MSQEAFEPVANPRFEIPGASPGEAAGWTLRTLVARQRLAPFGPAPARSAEDFERWSALLRDLAGAVLAIFDAIPEAVEDFQEGWDNEPFLFEWSDGDGHAAPLKAFEDAWSNAPYRTTWDQVAAVNGPLGPFDVAGYRRSWDAVTSVAAPFPLVGTARVEAFEVLW